MPDPLSDNVLPKIKELFEKGVPSREIAEKTGYTQTTINKYARKYGFKRPPDYKLSSCHWRHAGKKTYVHLQPIDLQGRQPLTRRGSFAQDCSRLMELNETQGVHCFLYGSQGSR